MTRPPVNIAAGHFERSEKFRLLVLNVILGDGGSSSLSGDEKFCHAGPSTWLRINSGRHPDPSSTWIPFSTV
jgi:hypothetical protein